MLKLTFRTSGGSLRELSFQITVYENLSMWLSKHLGVRRIIRSVLKVRQQKERQRGFVFRSYLGCRASVSLGIVFLNFVRRDTDALRLTGWLYQSIAQERLSPNQTVARKIEPGKIVLFSIALNDGDYFNVSIGYKGRI